MPKKQTTFEERLARLEEKHGALKRPPLPNLAEAHTSKQAPRSRGGKSLFVALAIGMVAAPVGYVFMTSNGAATAAHTGSSPSDIQDQLTLGTELLKTMYVSGGADTRQARREVDTLMLKLNTGTLKKEDLEGYVTDDGLEGLAQLQRDALNMDAVEALVRDRVKDTK